METGPKGVFAAVLTPFNKDLTPDHEGLVAHCRGLLARGCDGLAVLGTTGEANSLSLDERLGILEALNDAGIPGRALMPGTGCCALPDTVELTRRALDVGAAGVLMLPPFYYKSVSDDGLFAAYSEVIERVGDSRLRVYLYHFPQMSAVPLSLDLIERLLTRYPGAIAGIKDSSGDLANMAALVRAFPGLRVFSGADDLFLPLLKQGGAGCITALNNVACAISAGTWAAWRRGEGEKAAALAGELSALRALVTSFPQIAALKEIMARRDKDTGWRTVRPPLVRLGAKQAGDLFRALEDQNFAP